MNIAMILEMAADALGDRLAFGTRAEGLTYDELRNTARAVAERVEGTLGAINLDEAEADVDGFS